MKAIVYHNYGSPDVLQYEEIEKPAPKDNEVLIKVRAASVNPLDRGELKGVPYIFRIVFGLRKPEGTRPGRPGVDVAGQVEAIGRNVTHFKPGDEVFGVCISNPKASGVKVWVHHQGTFAEYACVPESTLVLKPNNVTFEQAACVPVAALTALQGLRDKGHIQPGQKVLIPLTDVGQKFTDAQLITLLHTPNSAMTNGGMTPVDLKPDALEALVAYLRQLH